MSNLEQLPAYTPPALGPTEAITRREAAAIFERWQRDDWFVDVWLAVPATGFASRLVGKVRSAAPDWPFIAGYEGAFVNLPEAFLTRAAHTAMQMTELGPRLMFTYDDELILVLLGIEPHDHQGEAPPGPS